MIHVADNLGCHVTGSSRGVVAVHLLFNPANPEVRYLQVAVLVYHYVLGLDVSVDYFILVNVLQSLYNISGKELDLPFAKLLVYAEVEPQVSPNDQVHAEVQVHPVLEGVFHVHNKLVA